MVGLGDRRGDWDGHPTRQRPDQRHRAFERDQLLRRVDSRLGLGLGVADSECEGAAQDAARGIDFLDREDRAVEDVLAVGLQIAGHGHQ